MVLNREKPGKAHRHWSARYRRGSAAIDYVLVLGIILPLAGFLYKVGPKIINLVYDMVCVLTAWPFP